MGNATGCCSAFDEPHELPAGYEMKPVNRFSPMKVKLSFNIIDIDA